MLSEYFPNHYYISREGYQILIKQQWMSPLASHHPDSFEERGAQETLTFCMKFESCLVSNEVVLTVIDCADAVRSTSNHPNIFEECFELLKQQCMSLLAAHLPI